MTAAAEELRVAQADTVLRYTLREAAREEMDDTEIGKTILRKQLAGRYAELSQLLAKHVVLTNSLSRAKSQSATGASVLDGLHLVAGNCERPAKQSKMAGQCNDSSMTPSPTAFLALPKEPRD